jgi:preprotein translocase subunit YajC
VADSFLILAQAAGPGATMNILFIAVMFGILYVVMIRPQQKQLKAHRELLTSLKKGDEVYTQGGLIGRIHLVSEGEVMLEVANGVRIRVRKAAVVGKVPAAGEAAAKPEEKKEEK